VPDCCPSGGDDDANACCGGGERVLDCHSRLRLPLVRWPQSVAEKHRSGRRHDGCWMNGSTCDGGDTGDAVAMTKSPRRTYPSGTTWPANDAAHAREHAVALEGAGPLDMDAGWECHAVLIPSLSVPVLVQ